MTDHVGSSLATSEILGNIEPAKSNENLCTNVASSDGNKDTKPCESAATAAPQPEVAASVGTAAGEVRNKYLFPGFLVFHFMLITSYFSRMQTYSLGWNVLMVF